MDSVHYEKGSQGQKYVGKKSKNDQYQFRNNSALDVFSIDELKKAQKIELVQKCENFRKYHSKSASMDFASPQNSK
jgi:hypothetical protein